MNGRDKIEVSTIEVDNEAYEHDEEDDQPHVNTTIVDALQLRRNQLRPQKSTIATRRKQAVCVRRAHKKYGPSKNPNVILDGLNMTVPKGCIYGLLGASGCGKTTLLSCIIGRRRLNSGEIWVLGGYPGGRGSGVPGPRIGYMPQEVALFGEFTIRETMVYFGWVAGMSSEDIDQRLDFLVKLLQLPSPNRPVKNLSGGQQRRVSLAAALLHQPELLILDEPTVGLDPILRQSIWDHLVQITSEEKTTVIITTHYIDETRQAHTIGLMRGGRFLAEESPESLITKYQAVSLEEVFLKLSVIQNMGKRRRSSILQEVTEKIEVPSIPDPSVLDMEEAEIGEVSGEFGDNVSMSSRGRVVVVPDPAVPPVQILPSEEEPPGSCLDRIKPMKLAHMKALIWKNFMTLIRNVSLMVFIIGLPISQVVIFCLAIGHEPVGLKIATVNYELQSDNMTGECPYDVNLCNNTYFSCGFLKYLGDKKSTLVPYSSSEEALRDAKKGEVVAVLVFQQNFSEALENRLEAPRDVSEEDIIASSIELSMDSSDKQVELMLVRDVEYMFTQFTTTYARACNLPERIYNVPINFQEPVYGVENPDFTDFAGPGVIITIIFFLSVALTAMAMLTERNEGILERSLVCGITGTEILFSHVTVHFFLMCVQTTSVLVFGLDVFKLTHIGPMFWIVSLTLLTGLCGMTFGFVVSCVCDTERTATYLALGSFLPMIMICGIIWPIEAMHIALQYISYILPLTKSTESLRAMLQRGWGIQEPTVYYGFISTIIWICLYLTLSILIIKFKKG